MQLQQKASEELSKALDQLRLEGWSGWGFYAPDLEDLLNPETTKVMTVEVFQRGIQRIAEWAAADGCAVPMDWAAAFEEES